MNRARHEAHRRPSVRLLAWSLGAALVVVGCAGDGSADPEAQPTDDPVAQAPEEGVDDGGNGDDGDDGDDGGVGNDGGSGNTGGSGADAAIDCPPPEDRSEQEDEVAEAEPSRCGPGPDEPTDDLRISDLELSRRDGPDPLEASFVVTNTTELTRRVVLPTVAPRVQEDDGGLRLDFLRIGFTHDEDGVSDPRVDVDDPGQPETVTVAAGESVTVTRPVRALPEQVADRLRLCLEVLPPPHPDTPNAQRPSGEEDHLPSFDIGFAPGEPVLLACSDPAEVGGGPV